MAGARLRLDMLLVERGLAESREKAHRLIRAGQVWSGDTRLEKPGAAVETTLELRVEGLGGRFVSRGGEKLQAALDRFGLDPGGRVCLDIGASTGGFTDCLLQAGAERVYALDVGRAQLHERLRGDPRVVSHEEVNARDIPAGLIPEHVEFCVVDVSFISLLQVVPPAARLMAEGATLLALVKPQFEAGRGKVGRGGVVRDPEVHREVLNRALEGLGRLGFEFRGLMLSPLRGPAGNREYLAWCVRGDGSGEGAGDMEAAIKAALKEAFE